MMLVCTCKRQYLRSVDSNDFCFVFSSGLSEICHLKDNICQYFMLNLSLNTSNVTSEIHFKESNLLCRLGLVGSFRLPSVQWSERITLFLKITSRLMKNFHARCEFLRWTFVVVLCWNLLFGCWIVLPTWENS